MPAKRVDDPLDQAVVLVAVDPTKERAARTKAAHQGAESRFGIGQVVEDADRVDEIEVSASRGSPEGRIVDVRLDDVRIGQVPDVFECRVDRIAQVDADHLFGTVSGREEGMRSEERRVGKECRSRWSTKN